MINCNIDNIEFSLRKNLIETNDSINQIKLMHKPESDIDILIVVDNSGVIFVITIEEKKNKTKMDKYEATKIQKYNSKINFHDNSPWSVDCLYPYIIIGSNNRTIFVFNYEEEQSQNQDNNNNQLISNSFIYKGNKNNIPFVSISDNGAFIGNNSIDKEFKIFDFHTGDLICTSNNTNTEWGWGIKFIPKNLFKIKEFKFDDYEKRKFENVSSNALISCHIEEKNLNNPSPYDEDNLGNIPYEELNESEKYIKINLIDKYFILATCNHCAGLFKLDYNIDVNSNTKKVVAIPLGKIELTRTYIRDLFMEFFQLDYVHLLNIQGIYQCSRYEFIFYSKNMNLILLGSKAGDLHVYEMNIYHDKVNKLIGVEDEPNILIGFGEKIAGMKFIENDNKKVIDVFVLTLTGMFYYYKILPNVNFYKYN